MRAYLWAKVIGEEVTDMANVAFVAGFGMLQFKRFLSEFFNFFGEHEWQITGFVFLILSVIKKVYDIKTQRDKYLKQKGESSGKINQNSGTGDDGDISVGEAVDKEQEG